MHPSQLKVVELVGVDAPLRPPSPASNGQALTDPKESIVSLRQKREPERLSTERSPLTSKVSDTTLSSRPSPSRVTFAPKPAGSKGETDAQSADTSLSKQTSRQSRTQRWKVSGGLLQGIYSVFQPTPRIVQQPDPDPWKDEDPLSLSILKPEQVQELIGFCTIELKARGKSRDILAPGIFSCHICSSIGFKGANGTPFRSS